MGGKLYEKNALLALILLCAILMVGCGKSNTYKIGITIQWHFKSNQGWGFWYDEAVFLFFVGLIGRRAYRSGALYLPLI